MLRIVGLQKHENAGEEFVLLQNQGHMRVILRGHVVMSESALIDKDYCHSAHAFTEEESIAPGLFVMLSTGSGQPHWGRTKDGAYVYHTYMQQESPIWLTCECPMHVLAAQHSYVDRSNRIEYLIAK